MNKNIKSLKLSTEYLESFIECDSIIEHWCIDCGKITRNNVATDEVQKAIKILKGITNEAN